VILFVNFGSFKNYIEVLDYGPLVPKHVKGTIKYLEYPFIILHFCVTLLAYFNRNFLCVSFFADHIWEQTEFWLKVSWYRQPCILL